MVITLWYKEYQAFAIVRPKGFDVKGWFKKNQNNFKLLGVTSVEYEEVS